MNHYYQKNVQSKISGRFITMHSYKFSLFFLVFTLFFTSLVIAEDEKERGDKYVSVRGKIQECFACHGETGSRVSDDNQPKASTPEYPILAGQEFFYLYTQLKDFKSGLRENAIMSPIASTIEKDEMMLVAEYFSEQNWPDIGFRAEPEDIKAGKKVVNAGQCVACHLGSFRGNSRVPRLAGQYPEYLNKTMLDFKNKVRANAAAKASLFKTFSEEEIRAVANYLGGFQEDE